MESFKNTFALINDRIYSKIYMHGVSELKKYKNLSNKILHMLKISNFQIRNKTNNISTVILLIDFLVYK